MVSIIMPVYNSEKYIKKAIESIINQTYIDWELIIVDDGSTDNSKFIIENFKDRRIKYIYQENKGQAAARNLALSQAKGAYIAFLDSDDIYLKNKLKKQVDFLEKNKSIDIVYNNVILIDENDEPIRELSGEIAFEKKEDFYAYSLFRQIIPCPPSMMIRKKAIENIYFPESYRNAEDYKFILNIAKKSEFKSLDCSLYLYRRHSKNVTNSHYEQIKSEQSIIKNLGINQIKKAVSETSFNKNQKAILLAKIFMKIEENILAKNILNEVKEKNEYIYFYIGNLNYMENNLEEAKMNYLKSLEINNNLAEIYNNLGVVLMMLGEEIKAKKCFEKAIEINDIYMDANYNVTAKSDFKITKRELRKQLTNYNI